MELFWWIIIYTGIVFEFLYAISNVLKRLCNVIQGETHDHNKHVHECFCDIKRGYVMKSGNFLSPESEW